MLYFFSYVLFFGSFFFNASPCINCLKPQKKENYPGLLPRYTPKSCGSFLKALASEGAPACRFPQRPGDVPDFMDVLQV
jgi:hypothetical protein